MWVGKYNTTECTQNWGCPSSNETIFLYQHRHTTNLKRLWLRDRCEPVKWCPLTLYLHGNNLFWPASSLLFNNKALQKKHCIMFVSFDIREANDNRNGAVVLKTWGHENFPQQELTKIKILRSATKGPIALSQDEPGMCTYISTPSPSRLPGNYQNRVRPLREVWECQRETTNDK